MALEFTDVARALSAAEFARRYLRTNNSERALRSVCPIHGGDSVNSLKFFDDGRCYCHVCKKVRDVVGLAAATWHCTQMEAARMLNAEFSLGLEDSAAPTAAERERRAADHQRQADAEQAARERWARLCDEERRARQAIERFTAADAERPEFSLALTRLCAAQTALDAEWASIGG